MYATSKNPGARLRHRRHSAGLTMVQTAIAISLAGSLLAIGVPTFQRSVRTSKISEAGESLGQLVRGASAYYLSWQQIDGQRKTQCLPKGAGPVPAEPDPDGTTVRLERYPDAQPTFDALGFSMPDPTRFRYTFVTTAEGCDLGQLADPVELHFIAEADLDDDGTMSRFTRRAVAGEARLEVDPLVQTERRVE